MGSLKSIQGAVVAVEQHHHEIHLGSVFSAGVSGTAIEDASFELLISVGNTPVQTHAEVACTGLGRVYVIEAPTVSVPGVAETPINRNRTSVNTTAGASVSIGPTHSLGTELLSQFCPSNTLFRLEDMILQPNTDYVFGVEHVGPGEDNFSLDVHFVKLFD